MDFVAGIGALGSHSTAATCRFLRLFLLFKNLEATKGWMRNIGLLGGRTRMRGTEFDVKEVLR